MLLNDIFKEYKMHVLKMSKNTAGINIDFHTDIVSDEGRLKQLYEYISISLLPIGGDITFRRKTFTVLYVRNIKLCMKEDNKV
jgi:hypothetical protein